MSDDLLCASCGDDRVVQPETGPRYVSICLGCGEIRVFERDADGTPQLVSVDELDAATKARMQGHARGLPLRALFDRTRGSAGKRLACIACGGLVLCVAPDCPSPRPGDLAFCNRCGATMA